MSFFESLWGEIHQRRLVYLLPFRNLVEELWIYVCCGNWQVDLEEVSIDKWYPAYLVIRVGCCLRWMDGVCVGCCLRWMNGVCVGCWLWLMNSEWTAINQRKDSANATRWLIWKWGKALVGKTRRWEARENRRKRGKQVHSDNDASEVDILGHFRTFWDI